MRNPVALLKRWFMRVRGRLRRRTARMSAADRMLFAKRLSLMLRAGMPIHTALKTMRDDAPAGRARETLASIAGDVEHGMTLADALAREPGLFDAYAIGVVRVGEASGTLADTLSALADDFARRAHLRRTLRGAMIYPAILITATIGITLILTMYIFPKIVPVFQSMRMTLPWSTRFLMAASAFLLRWWWMIAASIFCVAWVARVLYRKTERVRVFTDAAVLRMPLCGTMVRHYHVATICRTLAVLLRSDVEIVASVGMIADATEHRTCKRELCAIRDALARGESIASRIALPSSLFPPLVAHMVAVGETTGTLVSTLEYSAAHYEEEVNAATQNLVTLLEPLLMLTMGVIVGFIALSIILPIYGMTQSLSPSGV